MFVWPLGSATCHVGNAQQEDCPLARLVRRCTQAFHLAWLHASTTASSAGVPAAPITDYSVCVLLDAAG